MEPLKVEVDALRDILYAPLEDFITDKEMAERGEDKAQALAEQRKLKAAIKAVDEARKTRTTWSVVMEFGLDSHTHLAVTGFGTRPKALAAQEELTRTYGPRASAVVPSWLEDSMPARIEALDAPPADRGDWAEVAKDAAAFKRGWNGKAATRERYL